MTVNMSDKVLNRIIELASKGYDVRFLYCYGDAIQVRVSKNGHHAAHVIHKDEVDMCKFDIILYTIDRMVPIVDECLQRYK